MTVEFTNEEALPHNLSVYDSRAREDEIFVGEVIAGSGSEITYEFTAPEQPGDYFFVCDIHPFQMTGTFEVE